MNDFPKELAAMFGRLNARIEAIKASGQYDTVYADGWEPHSYTVSVANGVATEG
jgi:hypothetical protein